MKTYNVGLCDKDLDYVSQLMDYVNSRRDMGIYVTAFTGMSEVEAYLKVQDLDMVVTSDTSSCEETEEGYLYQDVKVAQLTEYKEYPRGWKNTNENLRYIFKFQRADLITDEIKGLLDTKTTVRDIHGFYAVYSPLGRCGKTRLAKALARDDEVRGGLYVAMEDFCQDLESLDNNLLYLLKSNSPELEEAVSSGIRTEKGFHSLILSGVYMDTHDVTLEDMERLKTCLLKPGRFTSIVFDIGSAALGDLRILNLFDRIYMPVIDDEVSVKKLEVFKKLLKDMGQRGLMTKMIQTQVPDVDLDSSEMERTLWRLEQEE